MLSPFLGRQGAGRHAEHPGDHFVSAVRADAGVDFVEVIAHGLLADVQLLRDFALGAPAQRPGGDLALAAQQAVSGQPVVQVRPRKEAHRLQGLDNPSPPQLQNHPQHLSRHSRPVVFSCSF